MNSRSFRLIVAFLAFGLLSAGCGPRADTLTPPAEPQISFTTDRTELSSGECATLQWSTQAAGSVSLDGRAVDRSGREQVCPQVATTYTLVLTAGGRVTRRDLVVSVRERPPPASPPPQSPPPGPGPTAATGPTAEGGLPDLTLVSIDLPPGTLRAGQALVITATLENLGSAGAADFVVDFLVDGEPAGSRVAGLLPGGSQLQLPARLAPLAAGSHEITIAADPGGWLAENDRANNVLRRSVDVEEARLADPVVESIALSPGDPATGQGVSIEVTIRNVGRGAAEGGFDVTLSIVSARFAGGRQPAACGPDSPFADEVIAFAPGPGADAGHADPVAALGAPDSARNPNGWVDLADDGSITLAFGDNAVTDGPGDDLRIWGRPGDTRLFTVEVSGDGSEFVPAGSVRAGNALDLARAGLGAAWYVRVRPGEGEQGGGALQGAGLDAVEAVSCLPVERDPLKLESVQRVERLEPGAQQVLALAWTAGAPGEYLLLVDVDPLDALRESDERNNHAERPFPVRVGQ